jgi:hypothetical protein
MGLTMKILILSYGFTISFSIKPILDEVYHGSWYNSSSLKSSIHDKINRLYGEIKPVKTVGSTKKGKAISLQAWTGPEGSRRLKPPDFKTIGTRRW